MKIVVVSDELYPIHAYVIDWLKQQGHEVILCGALASQQEESWVDAAYQASQKILQGDADEGIFFCWTGTGISLVANRFASLRAALCGDAETARAARVWNHANVLALSNRSLSQDVAREILTAWFEPYDQARGMKCLEALNKLVF